MSIKTLPMSYEEFAAIPDNPRQRDTMQRAKKAMRRHLRYPCPTHSIVQVASVNGVPICKLDGHTRCYLWGRGILKKPSDKLIATIYEVANMEEAKVLYTHIDSGDAVETSSDKLSGACRECGVHLTGSLLGKHNFNTAIKIAHALSNGGCGQTEYQIVPKWAKVLIEVDSWGLPMNKFRGTGLVALMFVSVAAQKIASDVVADFFTRFSNDAGEKNGKLRDGVQALTEHMTARRLASQMTGYDNILDMMSKGLSCLNAWSSNQYITNVQPARAALTELHAAARRNVDSGKFTND
jgi:hypothetical protein